MRTLNLISLLVLLSLIVNAQQFKTGLNFSDDKYNEVMLSARLIKTDYEVPPRMSLEKYCPVPMQQGNNGTCVGWATAYAARTIIYAIQNNLTKTTIGTNSFSPSFVYNQVKAPIDNNCQEGSTLTEALDLLYKEGVVKFEDLPNECNASITDEVKRKAANYKTRGYKKLFYTDSPNDEKIAAIRKAIAEKHPVVIGFNAPPSFQETKGLTWKPAETETPKTMYGGHAMTVVGYDNEMFGGAFRVMNSWGTTWADNGFVWIPYSYFADYCRYAFEVFPPAAPQIELSADIVFKLENGDTMQIQPQIYERGLVVEEITNEAEAILCYKTVNNYTSGTRFRYYLRNNSSTFTYALASDLSGKVVKIFPYKNGISPFFGYINSTFALPSENAFIKLDNTKGTDFLCVLYSKNDLNIDSISSVMNTIEGSFSEKITKVLNNRLYSTKNLAYQKNEIKFTARLENEIQTIVAILIEIEHK